MKRSEAKRQDPNVGILAARVVRSFEREMFEELADQGHGELRPRHGPVLAHLDADGTRASDLARLSGRHKQVIGTLVDELHGLGYVERRPDPADRRAKLVVPTEHGLDALKRIDRIVRSIEGRYRRRLGKAPFEVLKQMLTELASRAEGRT